VTPQLTKENGRISETRNTLVTASEIAQTTERSVVQSEQSLIIATADLNKRAVLQLAQSLLQLGQSKIPAHHIGSSRHLY
jgi:hypothetical protein